MKKKLIINIISLFLLVVLSSAFIWPRISETLENRKNHLALKAKIADLDKKIAKIESLGQELEKSIVNQRTVSEYLPAERGDDFLINYLDSIALTEEVSISNVAIKEKTVDINMLNAESFSTEVLSTAVSPQPVFEATSFNFFASYEKIMTLMRKFDSLKRFNEVASLKIVKTYPEDNKEDASLNFLQVELGLDFNHLKKINSPSEIGETLLTADNFDQDTIAKIKNRAINGASDPDGRTEGRKNPFIP